MWLDKKYEYKSFTNAHPMIVDHEDILHLEDGVMFSVLGECELKRVVVKDSIVRFDLVKDYEIANLEGGRLLPVGSLISLIFYSAKIMPNPVNDPKDTYGEAISLSELRPFSLNEAERSEGYKLGIEADLWEDGLWDVYYDHAVIEYKLPDKEQ